MTYFLFGEVVVQNTAPTKLFVTKKRFFFNQKMFLKRGNYELF